MGWEVPGNSYSLLSYENWLTSLAPWAPLSLLDGLEPVWPVGALENCLNLSVEEFLSLGFWREGAPY